MASVGRGRGWANIEERDASLRKPGRIALSKNSSIFNLISEIYSLDLHSTMSPEKREELKTLFKTAAEAEDIQNVFDTLHEQALEDKQFGIKFALFLGDLQLWNISISDDTSKRFMFLSALQRDFTRIEEIKKDNRTQFLNVVSLLGEIYYRVKVGKSKSLSILEVPFLCCVRMLLDSATEEDIELATIQISINGRKLYESKQAEMEELVLHGKTILINRNLSARSRGMLLLMIDLANQRYGPLSRDLQEFYLSQLGTETMVQIQRHDDDLVIITKPKKKVNAGGSEWQSDSAQETRAREPSIVDDTPGILMRASKPIAVSAADRISNLSIGDIPVPRAIRGSGATDDSKTRKNEKQSPRGKKDGNALLSKRDSFNKNWGHDDRFDKDYD